MVIINKKAKLHYKILKYILKTLRKKLGMMKVLTSQMTIRCNIF